MSGTDFDYPPTRTVTFGEALAALADEVDSFDGDDSGGLTTDERRRRQQCRTQHDGLQWAVGEWGEDATVTLQALTMGDRARVEDTVRTDRVGSVGQSALNLWLLAAALEGAPFVDQGADLSERVTTLSALPPAVVDWLNDALDELNDLSAGN